MAKTHFNEHAVWTNLVSIAEFYLLCKLLFEAGKEHPQLNWKVNLEKTEWIEDPKLGKRLHVVIDRPCFEGQDEYVYGLEYRVWERIKRTIYTERRKSKLST